MLILSTASRTLELESSVSWRPKCFGRRIVNAQFKCSSFGLRLGAEFWPHITTVPKEPSDDELEAVLKANSPLVDQAGIGLEYPKDVFSVIDMTARQVSAHYSKTPEFERLPLGERGRIEVTVDFEAPLFIQVGGERRALTSAKVIGNLYSLEHQHPVHFLRLVDVIDQRRPIAGCGLAEMSSGELMGITTKNTDNNVSVIHISAEDRKKVVIRRRRLR